MAEPLHAQALRAPEAAAVKVGGLPTRTKALYGLGNIGNQLFRDAPMMLLLFYLTSIIGIAPAIAGAAIFVPKVFVGALSDFAVGIVSDRNLHRFRRRNWLLVGAALAPVAMIATFFVPLAGTLGQVAYVIATFSFYMLTFASFSVPFLAHFSEISEDPQERTVLMAWKHAWTGAGLLLGSALTPWLIYRMGGDRLAYVAGAAFLGVVSSISLVTAWAAVRKVAVSEAGSDKLTLRVLLGTLAFRPFRILCLSAICMTVAAGTCSAALAFFITYAMGRADALVQLGILVAIAGGVVLVASPFWVWVAKRVGKRNAYVLGALGHVATLLVWSNAGSGPGSIWVTYVCSGFVGLFNSGWGLIALSLLTDAMAASRQASGRDTAGAFAAIWSMLEKAGIALGGTLVVSAILTLGGFDSAAAKQHLGQSAEAVTAIRYAFGYVPAALMAMAALIIWRFVPHSSPEDAA
ncbi:MFS transporter [Novosphingobium profundi]|uniref:MFS transporter n=1 Tax=Novosphingobium profundi TaxID=1774954 RepID=UPI001BDA28AD|nr:MFS transporter [Novosphingobium profundi]MBT0668178.1 MFS transporter [Novosphingobium profundi]